MWRSKYSIIRQSMGVWYDILQRVKPPNHCHSVTLLPYHPPCSSPYIITCWSFIHLYTRTFLSMYTCTFDCSIWVLLGWILPRSSSLIVKTLNGTLIFIFTLLHLTPGTLWQDFIILIMSNCYFTDTDIQNINIAFKKPTVCILESGGLVCKLSINKY